MMGAKATGWKALMVETLVVGHFCVGRPANPKREWVAEPRADCLVDRLPSLEPGGSLYRVSSPIAIVSFPGSEADSLPHEIRAAIPVSDTAELTAAMANGDEAAKGEQRHRVGCHMPEIGMKKRRPHDPVEPVGLAGMDAVSLKPITERHRVDDLHDPDQHQADDEQADRRPQHTPMPPHRFLIGGHGLTSSRRHVQAWCTKKPNRSTPPKKPPPRLIRVGLLGDVTSQRPNL